MSMPPKILRVGSEPQSRGLWVDMAPWQAQVFAITKVKRGWRRRM